MQLKSHQSAAILEPIFFIRNSDHHFKSYLTNSLIISIEAKYIFNTRTLLLYGDEYNIDN